MLNTHQVISLHRLMIKHIQVSNRNIQRESIVLNFQPIFHLDSPFAFDQSNYQQQKNYC